MRSSSSSAPISTTSPPDRRERTRSSSVSRSAGGRSAATTTCLPPSISALSVWQNSCWIDLPARNCRSSMTRMSMARSFSLNGDRGLRLERGDEAVHEALGREVEDAPARGSRPDARSPGSDATCPGPPRHGRRADCRAPARRRRRGRPAGRRRGRARWTGPTKKASKVIRRSSGEPDEFVLARRRRLDGAQERHAPGGRPAPVRGSAAGSGAGSGAAAAARRRCAPRGRRGRRPASSAESSASTLSR